jgi:hypothetical protein
MQELRARFQLSILILISFLMEAETVSVDEYARKVSRVHRSMEQVVVDL